MNIILLIMVGLLIYLMSMILIIDYRKMRKAENKFELDLEKLRKIYDKMEKELDDDKE